MVFGRKFSCLLALAYLKKTFSKKKKKMVFSVDIGVPQENFFKNGKCSSPLTLGCLKKNFQKRKMLFSVDIGCLKETFPKI